MKANLSKAKKMPTRVMGTNQVFQISPEAISLVTRPYCVRVKIKRTICNLCDPYNVALAQ